jgi:hypothetical protein
MIDVTFPVAKSWPTMVRSSVFDLARKMTSLWLTNHDSTSAPIKQARILINGASLGAPTMINIPWD